MLNSHYPSKREKIKNKKRVDEFKKYLHIHWSFFVTGKPLHIPPTNTNADFQTGAPCFQSVQGPISPTGAGEEKFA